MRVGVEFGSSTTIVRKTRNRLTGRVYYSLLVLISAGTAALGSILTEIAFQHFALTSLEIALVSNLFGGLFMLGPVLLDGSRSWDRWPVRDWLRLLAAASAMYCLGFLAFYAAIGHIGSSKTIMLGRLEAIFVIALAVVFLGEKWSGRHWFASFLALGGASLISFDPRMLELEVGTGEGMTLAAALLMAAGIVTIKPLLDRRDPLFVTGCGLLIGSALMVPFALSPAALVGDSVSATAIADVPGLAEMGFAVTALLATRGLLVGISWVTYNAPDLGLQTPSNLWTATAGAAVIIFAITFIYRQ